MFARRYWPEGEAVGQQIYDGAEIQAGERPFTVVGVVGAVKQTDLTEPYSEGAIYFPGSMDPTGFDRLSLVVRTAQTPEASGPTLQRVVRGIAPELSVHDLRSMETRIADSLVARKSPAVLAGIIAGVALVLATIGTYGVLGFAVAQRRREIGVRMALGAMPNQIARQFLLLGLRLLFLGMLFGGMGAWMTGRAMESILFDVPPLHLATLTGAAIVMAVTSVGACLLPAFRASRLQPMEALRSE